MKNYNRRCEMCGKSFNAHMKNQKYCSERCSRIACTMQITEKREQEKARRLAGLSYRKTTPQKSIADIIEEGNCKNLSYGQVVAQYLLNNTGI